MVIGDKLLLNSADGIWYETDPAPTYSLTITAPTNGSVASDTGGISCGATCTGYYASGNSVVLTATADSGYTFSSWGGDCSGSTNPLTVSMTANKACSATFEVYAPPIVATTTTVTSDSNPAAYGQSVTFTATVSPSAPAGTAALLTANGLPTGTVDFKDGGTSISGCASQTLASGVATCTTSGLSVGSHPITAVYSGNSAYDASTGTLSPNQIVISAPIPAPIPTLGEWAMLLLTLLLSGLAWRELAPPTLRRR